MLSNIIVATKYSTYYDLNLEKWQYNQNTKGPNILKHRVYQTCCPKTKAKTVLSQDRERDFGVQD